MGRGRRGLVDISEVELDESVTRYLLTRKESTAQAYEKCLKRFVVFYEKPFKEYIQEIENDNKANLEREVTEKVRPGEDTIRKFVEWHKEKGYANFSTLQSLGAVQNILKYYGIQMTFDFINKPKPIPVKGNEKHPWRIDHLREFVEVADYVRDKAFILIAFQSGLSVGDICSLDYGDIADDYENNRLPMIIRKYRQKTGVELMTGIGYDALRYLRLYLESRPNIQRSDPLFTMLGSSGDRMSISSMQARFKKYAGKVSFLDEAKKEGYNPVRPHSLRAGFRSRLTGKVDEDLIEFLMGHDIGREKSTYINQPLSEFRQMYAELEKYLAISKTSLEDKAESGNPQITESAFNELAERIAELTKENVLIKEQVNILGKAYMNSNEVLTQIIEDLVDDDVDKLDKYGEFMMKRLNREHYLGFEEDEKIGE